MTIYALSRLRARKAVLAVALLPMFGGCVTDGAALHDSATTLDGAPTRSSLQRAASSAANGGNVNVRLVGDVAYVTGRVDSALEENAIKRALSRVDGVLRVETSLNRDM